MSLTRTKLLAVAVLFAGALTTGIGSRVLSTADAQGQPPGMKDAEAEYVKRALDHLRTQQARDRWEYKFVPVEKPLAAADMQKVLSVADREGWEYCGSQDLVTGDKKGGGAIPHMVFKRPRPGATAAGDPTTAAGLYALAVAQQDKAAQEAAAAKTWREAVDKAKAGAAADEKAVRAAAAEFAKSIYANQIEAAKKAAEQDRDRAIQLEQMMDKLRAEQEVLLRKINELEAQKARQPEAARDPNSARPTDMILPLKHVLARDAVRSVQKLTPDDAIKVTLDERFNSLIFRGPPDMLAKVREFVTKSVDVPAVGPGGAPQLMRSPGEGDTPVALQIPLTNVDGKTAAEGLRRMLPAAKIVSEVHHKLIVLAGPAKVVDEAAALVRKAIDVKPADPTVGEKPETTIIRLQHAGAVELQAVLAKVFDKKGTFVADAATNSVVVSAPPAVLDEVRKLVIALDVERGGKK